jgi:REP element-mobilizing transposase RayT
VGHIIQAFKSITTHEYTVGVKKTGWPPFPGKLWQRNYWEHIVRNETELNRIRDYIHNNPGQWASDTLYGRTAGRLNETREPGAG